MVGYDYDTNAILVQPTKMRNAAELCNATMAILDRLERSGHKQTYTSWTTKRQIF